jgi:hypothetical protein
LPGDGLKVGVATLSFPVPLKFTVLGFTEELLAILNTLLWLPPEEGVNRTVTFCDDPAATEKLMPLVTLNWLLVDVMFVTFRATLPGFIMFSVKSFNWPRNTLPKTRGSGNAVIMGVGTVPVPERLIVLGFTVELLEMFNSPFWIPTKEGVNRTVTFFDDPDSIEKLVPLVTLNWALVDVMFVTVSTASPGFDVLKFKSFDWPRGTLPKARGSGNTAIMGAVPFPLRLTVLGFTDELLEMLSSPLWLPFEGGVNRIVTFCDDPTATEKLVPLVTLNWVLVDVIFVTFSTASLGFDILKVKSFDWPRGTLPKTRGSGDAIIADLIVNDQVADHSPQFPAPSRQRTLQVYFPSDKTLLSMYLEIIKLLSWITLEL